MNKMTLVDFLALTSFVAVAETNYVDCVNGVDDTSHGTAEDNAWATLNYAVDKSSAGDTVIVLPGVYTNGVSNYSRLNITKQLRFESRDRRDKTFIVGSQAEYDATAAEPHSSCVLCVLVRSGAAGTIVKGFTLTGGGQIEGGGANFSGASYLVDCVCSNNIATRGAAVMKGTIIRCLVTENSCASGSTHGTKHYNSVITRNYGGNMCSYPGKIVNCTIIENWDSSGAYAIWTEKAEDRAYGKDEIFSVGLNYDPSETVLLFR